MISSILAYGIPIILAALGGYLTDLSGLLNIALEGLIIMGAFSSFLAMKLTSSYMVAAAAAALMTALISLAYAALTIRLKGNIFITGLAMNLLIPGIITIVSVQLYQTGGVLQLSDTDFIPFDTLVWTYTLFVLSLYIVSYLFLTRTRAGLSVRASGLNRRAMEIRGENPDTIQIWAFGYSGLLCGLSGAFLTFTLHAFIPNISSGKGWLALAAIYLGGRRLPGLLYAVLFFAAAEMLANLAQGIFDLPASLFLGFPYLITFFGLIVRAKIAK
jgi:simple sugar transport system permease protein